MWKKLTWKTIYVPTLLLVLLVCLHQDIVVRRLVAAEFSRSLETLSWQSVSTLAGLDDADFTLLESNPSIVSAELVDSKGRVVGRYGAENGAGDWVREHEVPDTGGTVRLEGRLPGWTTTSRDLPIVAIILLFLFRGILGRPSSRPPQEGEDAVKTAQVDSDPAPSGRNLVMELDENLVVRSVSRGLKQFGYEKDNLIGRHVNKFIDRFHPDSTSSNSQFKDGRGVQLDSTFTSTLVRCESGNLERVVVTLTEDIEVNEFRRHFHQLHELYTALCDNANEQIFVLSPSLQIIYANRSLRELVGRSECQILKENFLELVAPVERLKLGDLLYGVLEEGDTPELRFALSADGKEFTLEGSFHCVSGNGTKGAVMAVFRDITEKLRLEEELRISRERSQHAQRVEALGRLAGGIAHDFNNLLATVMVSLGTLEERLPGAGLGCDLLADIRSAVDKSVELTGQLLVYSRKQPCRLVETSLHQVVGDVTRLTGRLLGSRVELEVDLKADADWILLEAGQLDQVLMNLVINANDALPEGGRIKIRTRNLPGNEIELRVEDNGSGIPQELQEKVLEPYFTTKSLGQGTGLGLSTVVAVVEKAGGRLALWSRPGQGTVFTIVLPAVERPAPAQKLSTPKVQVVTPKGSSVLLVEDMSSIRRLVKKILEKRGFLVTVAEDGHQAKQAMEDTETAFDLLITDLNLPGHSGPELASLYKRSSPSLPVLFMSGYAGDTLEETAGMENITFLGKPFTVDALGRAVDSLLAGANN